ncbi:hypothetical protein LWI28_008428 [Acer negundo]|uniref:Uncharacterized protein n=1 Tax=Acer negundo TaxID=4023 RepID=A0AAD5IHX6_ACENE|nr:hypothetical protein LWI28_008428 [Acer negundo]
MARIQLSIITIALCLLQLFSVTLSSTFTFTNKCSYTVWPGMLSGAGTAPLSTTGFTLEQGQSTSLSVPNSCTFTCAGADYVITFCPGPSTSVKSANNDQYPVSVNVSAGSGRTRPVFIGIVAIVLATIWWLW